MAVSQINDRTWIGLSGDTRPSGAQSGDLYLIDNGSGSVDAKEIYSIDLGWVPMSVKFVDRDVYDRQ